MQNVKSTFLTEYKDFIPLGTKVLVVAEIEDAITHTVSSPISVVLFCRKL